MNDVVCGVSLFIWGQVVRGRREVDDRMKEFFKRVNNNDPREVRTLLLRLLLVCAY